MSIALPSSELLAQLKAHGVTQTQIAKAIRVSPSAVSNLYAGTRQLKHDEAITLAGLLSANGAPSTVKEPWGSRLRKLREKANLTQAQLGEMIGATKAAIIIMEHADDFSTSEWCPKLADALGIDISVLTAGPSAPVKVQLDAAIERANQWIASARPIIRLMHLLSDEAGFPVLSQLLRQPREPFDEVRPSRLRYNEAVWREACGHVVKATDALFGMLDDIRSDFVRDGAFPEVLASQVLTVDCAIRLVGVCDTMVPFGPEGDLIAVAEDALKALEASDATLHQLGMMEGIDCPVIEPLRAAIAKARGDA